MTRAQLVRACLVALLPAVWSVPGGADDPPPPAPPLAVRAVAVAPGTAAPWRLTGVVRGRREVPLSFRVGGEVIDRKVVAGQAVRAGDVLFRLDDRDLRRALDSAQAQWVSARTEAGIAQREADRRLDLRRIGAIAAEMAERSSFEAVAAAERLRAAEAARAQAVNALSYAVVKAPADGIVTDVAVEPHQVVAAGQSLAVLAHAGGREAEVFVPESRRTGLPAEARAVLLGRAEPIPAVLREIAANADSASRSFRARYELKGMAADMPVGTSVTLQFSQPLSGLARLPLTAVADQGRGTFVWRIDAEGRARAHPVRVVHLLDEEALVESDLADGTKVVAMGTHRVSEGAALRVLP